VYKDVKITAINAIIKINEIIKLATKEIIKPGTQVDELQLKFFRHEYETLMSALQLKNLVYDFVVQDKFVPIKQEYSIIITYTLTNTQTLENAEVIAIKI